MLHKTFLYTPNTFHETVINGSSEARRLKQTSGKTLRSIAEHFFTLQTILGEAFHTGELRIPDDANFWQNYQVAGPISLH